VLAIVGQQGASEGDWKKIDASAEGEGVTTEHFVHGAETFIHEERRGGEARLRGSYCDLYTKG
jgi:hypothetical protein